MTPRYRHLSRLLLPICLWTSTVSSNAQSIMWQQLAATSRHRLDTADVHALRIELESISFFRNNEYTSPLAEGYSLPGLWLQPRLTYMPLRQIKVGIGLHALIFNGANRYPNYVYHDIVRWKAGQYTSGAHLLPWFRAQADFRHLSIILGNIYGGQNHGLAEPLFNPETNLTQDPETGFQLLWDRPRLHADIWLNWQSYIFREDNHQEAFTVGTTWRIGKNDASPQPRRQEKHNAQTSRKHTSIRPYLPVQLVLQHRGGEQNIENKAVQTICNASAGAGTEWNTGNSVLQSLTVEADALLCYQQKGQLWPFKSGAAGYASLDLSLWHFLEAGASYFIAPRHFVSLYGNHFYSTLSTTDEQDYGRLHTAAAHIRFHHTFHRSYTLGADAELWQTWQAGRSDLNFSFGIYLRVNPDFLIKRFTGSGRKD